MTCKEANIHFLLHSAALVEKAVHRALQPLGLGHSQARVLDALDRMGPSSQIELAQELKITAASMSTMTTRLLANGYVDRRQDPDEKRSNILRLSKGGVGLLSDVRSAWHSVDRLVEDVVGSKNADALFELALELRDAFGGRTPGERRARVSASDAAARISETEELT